MANRFSCLHNDYWICFSYEKSLIAHVQTRVGVHLSEMRVSDHGGSRMETAQMLDRPSLPLIMIGQ